MRISKILLCIAILFALNACKTKVDNSLESSDTQIEQIGIDPDDFQMKNAFASNIMDSCHFIPLATSDSIIIGNIKQIYEIKDKFYVFDSSSDIIFIFDQKGQFLSKIDHRGRGPEDYVKISDVFVDTLTNDIIISCDRTLSLVRYDCNGKFLQRIPNRFITSAFATINSDTIIAYGGRMPNESMFAETFPDQYSLVTMHNGKLIDHFFPNKYDPIFTNYVSKESYFFNVMDTLSYIEDFSNIIYRVHSSTHIVPRFVIHFGSHTLPINFHSPLHQVKDIINNYHKNKNEWCDVRKVIETKQILLIDYNSEELINHALYAKSKQKVINIGPIWVDDINGISMPEICNSSLNNTLLGYYEAHILMELVKTSKKASPLIQKLSEKLTEMDNPILVKIFLKNNLK